MPLQRLTADEFIKKIETSGSWAVRDSLRTEYELMIVPRQKLCLAGNEETIPVERYLSPNFLEMTVDEITEFKTRVWDARIRT